MNDEKRTHPLVWLLIVFVLVMLVDQYAEASGDKIKQEVQGDDSTAIAFGHALGDVDINDCMASTAWGTILVSRQTVILNRWCAAEVYDAKGLYEMAAKMRCDLPEIARHFDSASGCITANTTKIHVEPVEEVVTPDDEDEERAYHAALEARLQAIEVQSSKDTERAKRAARAARAAQAAAEEAKQVEQERREYAQQTLEALKDYRE